jgi:Abortive infection C-terminus
VPNHLDFLLAIDSFTRNSPGGCVPRGSDMHNVAHQAGLTKWGDLAAARWTGELVHLGYLTHGPPSAGDRRDLPHGPIWSDGELQRFNDYWVTATGREEADRLRRLERENQADSALGREFPRLLQPWMSDEQKRAIAQPLRALQVALDHAEHGLAIGAAKDLVEAACKVAIERTGRDAPRGAPLPTLFKQASATVATARRANDNIGRSLAATVQRLAELRNVAGAGHGHASLAEIAPRHARLAASAATGIADFLLSPSASPSSSHSPDTK